MNLLLLYVLLLKATVTSFSGLASLPVIRNDLIVNRHVLTDHQLNASLVITRSTPGPMGLYVVSVGYFVAGVPGAVAGWLAMVTPALLVNRADIHPRREGGSTARQKRYTVRGGCERRPDPSDCIAPGPGCRPRDVDSCYCPREFRIVSGNATNRHVLGSSC